MKARAAAWAALIIAPIALAIGGGTGGAQAPAADAGALFRNKCGACHLAGGTGTFMLGRRLGKDNALLAERHDLEPGYVRAVVRGGLNSMPPFTRVELTDAQLTAIADWLGERDRVRR